MLLQAHRAIISLARHRFVENYVKRSMTGMVSRFIAGTTVEQAIEVAQDLAHYGVHATLDILGENVDDADAASRETDAYIDVINAAANSGLSSIYVSVKLTALGLDISEPIASSNLGRILSAARSLGATQPAFVRVDMESSRYTDATLRIVQSLHSTYSNVGVVLQSCLYRTDDDIETMIEHSVPVRLVKGAYAEPSSIAYPLKRDVDVAYRRHMTRLLNSNIHVALATHDQSIIDLAKRIVREEELDRSRIEFQMLFGIRPDLRDALARDGHNVRTYIPFGSSWYPYFVRRLAERPANLKFVVSNILPFRNVHANNAKVPLENDDVKKAYSGE